jgi:HD-GYP domain-containing protein (c-di-GMP phosphodiesterase class II)
MQITLFDLIVCLSDSMDLVSPSLVNHHKTVAYIAARIAAEMNLTEEVQVNLLLAGALHDIGALPAENRNFAIKTDSPNFDHQSEIGFALLRSFNLLENLAPIVRFQHLRWDQIALAETATANVPLESAVLNLADRVAILIDSERNILVQAYNIKKRIADQSGKMFKPEVVEAFLGLAEREYFWLDMVSPRIYGLLRQKARMHTPMLSLANLLQLSMLFSKLIDFRSSFTATHSCGVSAVSASLGQFCGFSERECRMMKIAGHLHDIGKLAVPTEILEKPAKLTEEEFCIIKTHAYHTYRLLCTLTEFDTVATWAGFHHERLDCKGYPFRHGKEELSLGARIMGVADVFTAVSEDRPYRPGMSPDAAREVLKAMGKNNALDPEIVGLLVRHFDDVNQLRIEAQSGLEEQYRELFA